MKIGKYKIEHVDWQWHKCWGVYQITLFAQKKAPYSVFKVVRLVPRCISKPFYDFMDWKNKTFSGGASLSLRWWYLRRYKYEVELYKRLVKKFPDMRKPPNLSFKWYLTGKK